MCIRDSDPTGDHINPDEHWDVDLIGTLLLNLKLIDDGDGCCAENEVDPDASQQGGFEQRSEVSRPSSCSLALALALMPSVCRDEHDSHQGGVLGCLKGWSDVVIGLIASGLFLMLPSIPGADLSLFRQLNSELGALCQEPPVQALRVCRLHARLVNG